MVSADIPLNGQFPQTGGVVSTPSGKTTQEGLANTYLVGGAVRDRLLGRAVKDRDWVVVGSTVQAMLALGYAQVGADFPVFLHPVTREEYALARTERKTGKGYQGFEVDAGASVTLEQDLSRRDLTINAMAEDAFGNVIDPHGGQQDLASKVLRHVSSSFAEDPVRILRVARFAARYSEFTVAPETMALMSGMVDAGEVDTLVAERVWQELTKGLMEAKPARMIEVLRACGALRKLLPELDALWGVRQPELHHPEVCTGAHMLLVLDEAARLGASLEARFACLCHDFGKATTEKHLLPRHLGHEGRSLEILGPVCDRFKVSAECRQVAEIVAREHSCVHGSQTLDGTAVLRLLDRCDAIRRPRRFEDILMACEADARGRLGLEDRPYPQRARLMKAVVYAKSVDTTVVSARALALGRSGPEIGEFIHAARATAIKQGFAEAAALRAIQTPGAIFPGQPNDEVESSRPTERERT